MHATGFHGRIWEPFVPQLREHFSVIALDQRGHGDSDKPEHGYQWARFGDDALAVVSHLGLERPAGIGHSAGAAALTFADLQGNGFKVDGVSISGDWSKNANIGFDRAIIRW